MTTKHHPKSISFKNRCKAAATQVDFKSPWKRRLGATQKYFRAEMRIKSNGNVFYTQACLEAKIRAQGHAQGPQQWLNAKAGIQTLNLPDNSSTRESSSEVYTPNSTSFLPTNRESEKIFC